MYNGIGIHTPRGSATSGHVTKNLSQVHYKRKHDVLSVKSEAEEFEKPVNKDILEHNKKRIIEAKLFELEESMLELGYEDVEIQTAMASRRRLLENDNDDKLVNLSNFKKSLSTNSHVISEEKAKSNERFRDALRLPTKSRAINASAEP